MAQELLLCPQLLHEFECKIGLSSCRRILYKNLFCKKRKGGKNNYSVIHTQHWHLTKYHFLLWNTYNLYDHMSWVSNKPQLMLFNLCHLKLLQIVSIAATETRCSKSSSDYFPICEYFYIFLEFVLIKSALQ